MPLRNVFGNVRRRLILNNKVCNLKAFIYNYFIFIFSFAESVISFTVSNVRVRVCYVVTCAQPLRMVTQIDRRDHRKGKLPGLCSMTNHEKGRLNNGLSIIY